MQPPRSLVVAACLALAVPSLAASDLTVGGTADLELPYGSGAVLSLAGAPVAPAFVLLDATPGPVDVGGVSVPLGLTPALRVLFAGATNAGGDFVQLLVVPNDPALSGVVAYLAGAVADGSGPLGLDVSNGASVTVAPPVGAGEDLVALVGVPVALDGGGALRDDGLVPPATTLTWTLVEAPVGSAVGLSNATEPFAVLEPDLPGTYRAELRVEAGTASVTDEVRVDAFALDLAPGLDAAYATAASVAVSGALTGPDVGATLRLNGAPLTLAPGGAFGPTSVALPVGDAHAPLLWEVATPDGRVVRRRTSLGLGFALPVAGGAPAGLSVHLSPAGLDEVAVLGEAELEAADVQSVLLALPPTQVANTSGPFGITLFSATVDFTSVSYSPDVQLTLSPIAGGVHGVARLTNVKATFDVDGEIVEVDYSLSGQITSSPVDLSATLDFSVVGGQVQVATLNPSVVRNNFQFDLDGFFGSVAELFIIESYVKEQVEDAVAGAIGDALGPAIEEIVNGLDVSGNLYEQLEVDVQVGAAFASVQESTQGVTLGLTGTAQVVSAEPGSPAVTLFPYSLGGAPAYGPVDPGGLPYEAAVAGADDFLNLVLAASTGAGLLDGDLTALLDSRALGGAPGEELTAGALAVLFPGAGFGGFPPDAVVDLRATGSLPPRVRTTPGGPGLGRIDLAGLEVVFRLPGADAWVPVLRVALDAGASLDLAASPDGTLAATLGDASLDLAVLAAFPGGDLTVLQAGVDLLASFLLPALADTLGSVPLPSLAAQGLALQPQTVAPVGPAGDYVGFFGDFAVVPVETR